MAEAIPSRYPETATFDIVRDIVSDVLGIPGESIFQETTLAYDIQADSLDIVDISIRIEQHFNITLVEQPGSYMHTIQDIINAVRAAMDYAQDINDI